MKYNQFIAAFNRAKQSNGPWFSTDDWKDIAVDIRSFCSEDWEEMLDAVDSVEQLYAEIRHAVSQLPTDGRDKSA